MRNNVDWYLIQSGHDGQVMLCTHNTTQRSTAQHSMESTQRTQQQKVVVVSRWLLQIELLLRVVKAGPGF